MRSPIDIFRSNIQSVKELHALHGHFSNILKAMDLSEMLRSEYVLVISAMDRFLHDIVKERLLKIDIRDVVNLNISAQKEYPISLFTVKSLLDSPDELTRNQLLETDLKKSLEKISFQSSKSIESAMTLIGCKKLWSKLGKQLSLPPEDIKKRLDIIIRRRNIIAHQADISNDVTLEKNNIERLDVDEEIIFIEKIVETINRIV